MKNNSIQQEILLSATSALVKCTLGGTDNRGQAKLPFAAQLEKACWSGLLNKMFPEVFGSHSAGTMLFIWHIRQGASCLQVQLSTFPSAVERACSIDPYLFLRTLSYN